MPLSERMRRRGWRGTESQETCSEGMVRYLPQKVAHLNRLYIWEKSLMRALLSGVAVFSDYRFPRLLGKRYFTVCGGINE